MKSMKFLSLSLLMVSFGGSVLASEADEPIVVTEKVTKEEVVEQVLEQGKMVEKQSTTLTKEVEEQGKNEGIINSITSTITNATRTQIGLGVAAVAVTGGVVAYKYNPAFNTFVNETAGAVQDKVNEIKKDSQKTALVVGGVATAAALGGLAYHYDVAGKISNSLSSSSDSKIVNGTKTTTTTETTKTV